MRFAKMPDETVELISSASAKSTKNAGLSQSSGNPSSSKDTSDSEEDRASRLAELQEQVGAEQVGSCTHTYTTKTFHLYILLFA